MSNYVCMFNQDTYQVHPDDKIINSVNYSKHSIEERHNFCINACTSTCKHNAYLTVSPHMIIPGLCYGNKDKSID